jgi:hypothetical protein
MVASFVAEPPMSDRPLPPLPPVPAKPLPLLRSL